LSLVVGFFLSQPFLYPYLLAGVAVLLVVLAPPSVLPAVALGLAAGLCEPIPALAGNKGQAAGVVVAAVAAFRAWGRSAPTALQTYAAAAVAGFAAFQFVVGLSVTPEVAGVAISSLPYALIALLLLVARRETIRQALMVLAAASAVVAVLQVLSTVTGTVVIPGAFRQLPFEFGPLALERTYTYALPLFVFGFLWSLSTFFTPGRSLLVHGATVVSFLAIVATGFRLVYVAASIAAVGVMLLRASHGSRRYVATVAGVASLAAGLLAFSGPLSQGIEEVSTGSGSYSARADLARDVGLQLEARPVFGAGFAATEPGAVTPGVPVSISPGSGVYQSSDSSYASLLVRYGVVGTALVVAFLAWAVRSGFRLHRTSARYGDLSLVLLGYIVYAVMAGIGNDSLISITSLGVVGFLMGGALAAMDDRVHGSAATGTLLQGRQRSVVVPAGAQQH
jgi:hypothetical protein